MSKLDYDKAQEIRRHLAEGVRAERLALDYDVSFSAIDRIRRGWTYAKPRPPKVPSYTRATVDESRVREALEGLPGTYPVMNHKEKQAFWRAILPSWDAAPDKGAVAERWAQATGLAPVSVARSLQRARAR